MTFHGGQQYSYQILTAIAYVLEHRFDAVAIEGDGYEDSMFYRDGTLVAVGEAKDVQSLRHWTARSLFYRGREKGPLLQLWNRWLDDEDFVFFSSIPLERSIQRRGQLRIPDETLAEIVERIQEKVEQGNLVGIRRIDQLDLLTIREFTDRVNFIPVAPNIVELRVMRWANAYGRITDLDGVNRLLGYFNSAGYVAGSSVTRESLLLHLLGPDIDSESAIRVQESRRGEMHAEIVRSFTSAGWDVKFGYELSIYTDMSTLRSESCVFEALITREEHIGTGAVGRFRYYIPIRCLAATHGREETITFSTIPRTIRFSFPYRFLPFRRIRLERHEVEQLVGIFHESSNEIAVAPAASGNLTAQFNSVLDDLLSDRVFLFNRLQEGNLVDDYIIRQIGGDLVPGVTILCPVLVVDGIIMEDPGEGTPFESCHVYFERQGQHFDVISRALVNEFVATLTSEYSGIRDFLSALPVS